MYFKWQEFCDRYQVPYVTKGPNTARNNISIRCPFCGQSDEAEHMGLSLNPRSPDWGCWRARTHRGRDPRRLIAALLQCSDAHADSILRQGALPELDSFEALFSKLKPEVEHEQSTLSLSPNFRPLATTAPAAQPFLDYLEKRGFTPAHEVAETYGLLYATQGSWKQRVILPIFLNDALVGWTGRDITGASRLRYKSLTDDVALAKEQGVMPAPISLKHLVLWQDAVMAGGRALLIVEGPLDALKVDFFNRTEGVVTTCLFGKPTNAQVKTLSLAARGFDRVGVMLDPDAWSDALHFVSELEELSGKKVYRVDVGDDAEDPGAMNEKQVLALIERFLKST
jgi:hypothetical protein